jgi:hypothetical protein
MLYADFIAQPVPSRGQQAILIALFETAETSARRRITPAIYGQGVRIRPQSIL